MIIKGNIVNVLKKEIYPGKIIIKNNFIKKIIREDHKFQKYILPGFVDAHVHIESAMLTPVPFGNMAVRCGTIGVVADPHEIVNVMGVEGFSYMIGQSKKCPIKINWGVPSCVPATNFETNGAKINTEEIEEIFKNNKGCHLAEMMNYPGVINEDKEVVKKIEIAKKFNRIIDGHAPELSGKALKKYCGSGISTDHECSTVQEAKEKIKYGMKILIREGSAAKNMNALAPLIDEYPDEIMFCSDDIHPDDLEMGHINKMVQWCIREGYDFWNVIRAATINPIKFYGMDVGLLQEGDKADFVVSDSLKDVTINEVYIEGKKVFSKEKGQKERKTDQIINRFDCDKILPEQLRISSKSCSHIRVIGANDGSLITEKRTMVPKIEGNRIISDVDRDILKIVIVNRYVTQPPVIGFVHGFGLKKGAIASSIAHDSHNIISVGTEDYYMTDAINAVIDMKGGIVVRTEGKMDVLPLPVAGLMTNESGGVVARQYKELTQQAKKAGSNLKAPFMTLSFMALLVIPSLKLSDKGLFDVDNFDFVSLCT